VHVWLYGVVWEILTEFHSARICYSFRKISSIINKVIEL